MSPALAQALINRGIKKPEEASAFFSPSLDGLSDPLSMDGVGAAADAIEEARKRGRRIFVHGDYDADGATATAIMVGALRRRGLDVCYYVPDRFRDGYGFNPPAVDKAEAAGAGLIITVDCGISSFEAAKYAKSKGIGLIITDHHEGVADPSIDGAARAFRLPEAICVVNPKLTGGPPLSGAGVALKTVMAVVPRDVWRGFLDVAAVGTMADFVPLTGENRIIAKHGLAIINGGGRPGLKALREVSRLQGEVRAVNVVFGLVPRMNAAGRMADASEVVELLLTESEDNAFEIASSLDRKNSARQRVEESLMGEALLQLERKGCGPAVVLWAEGWHEGVMGIAASRIAERFYRPAFVFSVKDGVAKGSARGVPGFDVHGGLTELKDMLLSYGGHKEAAGLRLRAEGLEEFEKKIAAIVQRGMGEFSPTLCIDAEIRLEEINSGFMEGLSMFEPFGAGNPEPVFGSKGLRVTGPRVVGGNHLKMRVGSRSHMMDAIGFEMGGLLEVVESARFVDAAYAATPNEWKGRRSFQLNLKALRAAEALRDVS